VEYVLPIVRTDWERHLPRRVMNRSRVLFFDFMVSITIIPAGNKPPPYARNVFPLTIDVQSASTIADAKRKIAEKIPKVTWFTFFQDSMMNTPSIAFSLPSKIVTASHA
jgi:hypothetical protein